METSFFRPSGREDAGANEASCRSRSKGELQTLSMQKGLPEMMEMMEMIPVFKAMKGEKI